MKILIVSDTHRDESNLIDVIQAEEPIDFLIHCGDVEGAEYEIKEYAGCPTVIVAGNNDYFSNLPREEEFELGNYRIWVTHGHNYYVSMDTGRIKEEAVARGVDIVMFGHTHKPVIEQEDDIIALNPGSLTYPRQDGRKPSYIIMDIDKKGKAHFSICFL